jgi:AcrR family transcriptional regulator
MALSAAVTSDDTRAKLLNAAGALFADKGFESVTVRQICAQANANVAAVNYHFGDKRGLYNEVVLSIVKFAQDASAGPYRGKAEAQLREFVSRYLRGMLGEGRPAWVTRLMQREMMNPTPALKHIVESVVVPTEKRLREIIAAILRKDPGDECVRLCAHSVIGQCLHYKHACPVFVHLWPDLWADPKRVDILVDHIATFSLAAFTRMSKKTS